MFFGTYLTKQFVVGSVLVLGSIVGFGFHINLSSDAGPQIVPRETRRPTEGRLQNVEDSLTTPLLVV